jgi:hypothetical protein
MGLFTEADTQLACCAGCSVTRSSRRISCRRWTVSTMTTRVRAITAADALARFSERLRAVGAGTLAARSPGMPGTAGSRSRAVIATPSRSCRT